MGRKDGGVEASSRMMAGITAASVAAVPAKGRARSTITRPEPPKTRNAGGFRLSRGSKSRLRVAPSDYLPSEASNALCKLCTQRGVRAKPRLDETHRGAQCERDAVAWDLGTEPGGDPPGPRHRERVTGSGVERAPPSRHAAPPRAAGIEGYSGSVMRAIVGGPAGGKSCNG